MIELSGADLEHFVTDAATGEIYAGKHLIRDFWNVNASICCDVNLISKSMIDACEKAGATILGHNFHHFGEGYGVTGVVMLSESHASIHTWPEAKLMTIDIFMCGNAKPDQAFAHLAECFKPSTTSNHDLHRGIIKPGN